MTYPPTPYQLRLPEEDSPRPYDPPYPTWPAQLPDALAAFESDELRQCLLAALNSSGEARQSLVALPQHL